jgi:hypothetical protein
LIRKRNIDISQAEVPWIHSQMTQELETMLRARFPGDQIKVEAKFRDSLARVDVLREDSETKELHLYEVKTSTSAEKCDRAAIGQLLEYAGLAQAQQRVIGSITTVGLGASTQWIGRSLLAGLPFPWEYISLE